jgi:hypothetical protein
VTSTWVKTGNIKGPPGEQGIPGDQGIQGPEGPQGDTPQFKGAWNATTNYAPLDNVRVVTGPFAGSSFVALIANINVEPGGAGSAGVWELIARAGIQGPQGLVGPAGPQGETGAAGASSSAFHYEWKINTTRDDPGHGYVKANINIPTAFTELYVSTYDINGQAFLPALTLEPDDEVYLYEGGQIGTWNLYQITAPVEPQGTPIEWVVIPVTYVDTGPLAFTPGQNSDILLTTPIRGEPGPTGPTGAEGPQGIPGNQGIPGIQGSPGEVLIVTLTQAEYDAIPVPDPDTLYIISDGPGPVEGPPGPPGIQGIQGIKGDTGATGAASTVPGPQGIQGIQGDQGIQGEQGDPGDPTELVTVSTDPPSGTPAQDGLLWVVIP